VLVVFLVLEMGVDVQAVDHDACSERGWGPMGLMRLMGRNSLRTSSLENEDSLPDVAFGLRVYTRAVPAESGR
jgi:hypothetical protein